MISNNEPKYDTCHIQIVGWKKTGDTILCKVLFNEVPFCFGIRNANFPIPDGVYTALAFKGKHPHTRLILVGVQHHSGVEIHEGNKAKDVDGCTCVGQYLSEEAIIASVDTLSALIAKCSTYKKITVELACSLFYNKPQQANNA